MLLHEKNFLINTSLQSWIMKIDSFNIFTRFAAYIMAMIIPSIDIYLILLFLLLAVTNNIDFSN